MCHAGNSFCQEGALADLEHVFGVPVGFHLRDGSALVHTSQQFAHLYPPPGHKWESQLLLIQQHVLNLVLHMPGVCRTLLLWL